MKPLSLLICLIALSALATNAKADQLIFFGFSGGTGNGTSISSATYDSIGPLVSSATAIGTNASGNNGLLVLSYRTSGTLNNQTGGQGTTPAFPTINAQYPNGTYAAAPITGDFFTFSFVAAQDLNLSDIAFDMARGSTTSSTRGVDVVYNINGGANTDLGTSTDPSLTGAADVYRYYDDSFSSALVQSGQTVNIIFNPFSTSGGGVRFDNIVVNGAAVATPEPSSIALLVLGFAGAFFCSRKKS